MTAKSTSLENQLIVIFGASGDLTARKLIPSVFNLFKKDLLPERYAILGVGRSVFTDNEFRDKVVHENNHLKAEKSTLEGFASLIHYQSIDTSSPQDYTK